MSIREVKAFFAARGMEGRVLEFETSSATVELAAHTVGVIPARIAKTLSFLIDKIKEEQIPVVFHTELSNEKMTDCICEATGAKKLLLHSCHNVSKDDFESGATYLSLMEQNVSALKEALN